MNLQVEDVVKVSYLVFEQFLTSRENEYWKLDDDTIFEAFISGSPLNINELMGAIIGYAGYGDYVYIFNSENDPYEIAQKVDWKNIIEIKNPNDLNQYIVRNSMGKDFLWFASGIEMATDGNFVTLIPSDQNEWGGD